jgi:CBS-domain-containing membrane protein
MTRAGDVMRRGVVAVGADAPIDKAVRLMLDQRLGAVPVVDTNRRLVGFLTEGDLIARRMPRRSLRWWEVLLHDDAETLAGEYRKAFGTSVGEVMTPTRVSVSPDAPLEEVAALMREHGVRAVPVVVAHDELVGVVTSAEVIEGLADRSEAGAAMASDVELEREMRRRMQSEPWLSTQNILVQAEGGIVSLHGLVGSEAERSALATMARAIPGCRGVDVHFLRRRDVLRHYAA